MPEPVVLVETSDRITTVTLNRPSAMNALSMELRSELTAAFQRLKDDPATEVIILTGAGRAFCAGLDLKELGGETGNAPAGQRAATNADIAAAMMACPQPIIAAINGVAITGGFELALACDILIGSTEARFADTHARVGIMPGWGLSQRLPRLIGISRAKELSLTGNFLAAERAERWGLLNHVVAPDELLPFCRQLAQDMLTCAPGMVQSYKRVIDDGYATTFGEGLELEVARSREHMRGVTPEQVKSRRIGIQERGRAQTSE
ncbi:MAG: enoyl-CoA hydratase [Hyphomicrobiales bacterium]